MKSYDILYRAVVLILGGCTVASVALADEQASSGSTSATETTLQEITVTGSRVITNGNDSPTPITVVTADELTKTNPSTVFQALQELPSVATSQTSFALTGPAVNAIDLRGIGAPRTLVLLDGHRLAPTSNAINVLGEDGVVDINTIPQMLLERVDVVTGGVSAVYGSDGISGVVNFVTDNNFNGVKFKAQEGDSQLNDDRSNQLGIAAGTNLFGGRGHIEASLERDYNGGIMTRTTRELGADELTMQGDGTAANPYFLLEGGRLSGATFGGKITGPANNPLNNTTFSSNGVLSPFVNGKTSIPEYGYTLSTVPGVQMGGGGAYDDASSLMASLGLDQLFGRFDFDVTNDIHLSATVTGSRAATQSRGDNQNISNVTMSATNAFLPTAYQTAMTGAGLSTFTFSKYWQTDVVPVGTYSFTKDLFDNIMLEGKLGDNYKWQGSFSNQVSGITTYSPFALNNGNLAAALNAVNNPATGQPVCSVTLTNPGLYPGCVPLNVFGPNSESPAAAAYIQTPVSTWTRSAMPYDFAASISGSPVSTWAGPITAALSGELRELSYALNSSQQPAMQDPLSCTGLIYNCKAGSTAVTTVTAAIRTPVSETIDEGALELEVPVVKDLSIVRAASLNGAVRYAAYDSAGNTMPGEANITNTFSALTWKGGLDVHLDEGVTLRATRSRDFRAPTLIDLYQPASVALAVFKDDLTGSAPQVPMSTSGNPQLKPEVAYTTTGGVVWQPIRQFSLSVDYFNINISDAILSVNGAQDNIQDACYASGGSSFYCSLQSRPSGYTNTSAANVVTEWFVQPLNIAELRTWGADFESDFRTTVLARPLSLRAFATFQPHLVYEQPGVATYDQAGVDFNNSGVQSTPVWHMLGTVDYVPIDPLTITWQTTWRSELHHPFSTTEAYAPGYMFVPPVSYTNLNLSYRIQVRSLAQLEVYLNIQDLFNQQPPLTSFSGTSAVPGQAGNGFTIGDDPIGRYFTLGVRGKF